MLLIWSYVHNILYWNNGFIEIIIPNIKSLFLVCWLDTAKVFFFKFDQLNSFLILFYWSYWDASFLHVVYACFLCIFPYIYSSLNSFLKFYSILYIFRLYTQSYELMWNMCSAVCLTEFKLYISKCIIMYLSYFTVLPYKI